jgi:hypothetical protein
MNLSRPTGSDAARLLSEFFPRYSTNTHDNQGDAMMREHYVSLKQSALRKTVLQAKMDVDSCERTHPAPNTALISPAVRSFMAAPNKIDPQTHPAGSAAANSVGQKQMEDASGHNENQAPASNHAIQAWRKLSLLKSKAEKSKTGVAHSARTLSFR